MPKTTGWSERCERSSGSTATIRGHRSASTGSGTVARASGGSPLARVAVARDDVQSEQTCVRSDACDRQPHPHTIDRTERTSRSFARHGLVDDIQVLSIRFGRCQVPMRGKFGYLPGVAGIAVCAQFGPTLSARVDTWGLCRRPRRSMPGVLGMESAATDSRMASDPGPASRRC